MTCQIPPAGWECSRDAGHDGPCAATRYEPMPLTGIRLFRWKLALRFYRIGCAVSGRHEALAQYEPHWRDWFCPHCGKVWSDEC